MITDILSFGYAQIKLLSSFA